MTVITYGLVYLVIVIQHKILKPVPFLLEETLGLGRENDLQKHARISMFQPNEKR